ncbi:hypothetical protein HOE04_05105 [archaeon]|jgi:hypothetical protein|nr:hypothetical protein [archaeon]
MSKNKKPANGELIALLLAKETIDGFDFERALDFPNRVIYANGKIKRLYNTKKGTLIDEYIQKNDDRSGFHQPIEVPFNSSTIQLRGDYDDKTF